MVDFKQKMNTFENRNQKQMNKDKSTVQDLMQTLIKDTAKEDKRKAKNMGSPQKRVQIDEHDHSNDNILIQDRNHNLDDCLKDQDKKMEAKHMTEKIKK